MLRALVRTRWALRSLVAVLDIVRACGLFASLMLGTGELGRRLACGELLWHQDLVLDVAQLLFSTVHRNTESNFCFVVARA